MVNRYGLCVLHVWDYDLYGMQGCTKLKLSNIQGDFVRGRNKSTIAYSLQLSIFVTNSKLAVLCLDCGHSILSNHY